MMKTIQTQFANKKHLISSHLISQSQTLHNKKKDVLLKPIPREEIRKTKQLSRLPSISHKDTKTQNFTTVKKKNRKASPLVEDANV